MLSDVRLSALSTDGFACTRIRFQSHEENALLSILSSEADLQIPPIPVIGAPV
jgi:hypothetical protein